MKDEALNLVAGVVDPSAKLNILREFLQTLTLRSLHESKAFLNLAFVGGTALRFVASLPRFSEDLDFSRHAPDGYEPVAWMKKVKQDLTLAGFDAEVSWSDKTTVHKGWIRVGGILKNIGLSAMAGQKLSINVKIDTNPPEGAVTVRNIINRHRLLALQYYDLPSLMAGKLHALITRSYPKGRDWYDLVWYCAKHPPVEPNLALLTNALNQTAPKSGKDASVWRAILLKKLDTLDTRKLVADVAPFLERPDEAQLLSDENLRAVLAG